MIDIISLSDCACAVLLYALVI